jgi:hypothetical protein
MLPSEAPMWPQVRIGPSRHIDGVWYADTCTMRPPISNGRGQTFRIYIQPSPSLLDAVGIEQLALEEMWSKYIKAHPNNCSGVQRDDLVAIMETPPTPGETA